ncbi:high frequency lysogenization protein HflD [Aliikangiella coralliicola]|uniref:High frequency lysogenization protein HflD homolog n=1 Tax=Aliikangiella coralliicola TaxID=2592383 RepID=A0A545U4S5_9GAMM|nr:high frequency lysogenization protein HflD [Aliikangiella coralliicola]TQV84462.1 high frequency lysogenization protein HflD [Aliikangiella coralliicola]
MSFNEKIIDQCIALAGLAQSVRVVQNLAWKGQTSESDFKAVIASLLRIDAVSAAGVYNGSFEVSSGLRILNQQLDPQHRDKDPEFVNLAINVMSLQTQLDRNQKLMDVLTQRIQQLSTEYSDQAFYSEEGLFADLVNGCSETYKQTLSRLPNRIQVKGEPKFLKIPENQARVRAALLAAIRACFLWRQSGGSRWHFLFRKKQLLEGIRHLIASPVKE